MPPGMSVTPFWRRKSLADMSGEEWEPLCDGCAKCCLHKLEDTRSGEISCTNVACRLLDADGGWSAVLQVPAVVPEEELILTLLDQDGVLVHPGYFFDFPREAYLVLSLLPVSGDFDEGLRRILRRVTPS